MFGTPCIKILFDKILHVKKNNSAYGLNVSVQKTNTLYRVFG